MAAKNPKGTVVLSGLDQNKTTIVELHIPVEEYYSELHELLDDDPTFRKASNIRSVTGLIYDYDGKLDQKFINEYDEDGERKKTRIEYSDGSIVER